MTDTSLALRRPPPPWWKLGPALWFASAMLLVVAYLVFNIPGNWFGGSAPQEFPGSSMTVFTGSAQAEDGKMVVSGPDSKNAVILGQNTPFISTQQYGLISPNIEGLPDNTEVTLFWRNDLAPNKMFTRPLAVAGGRVQDVIVAGDSNWLGRIHMIGLIIRGPLPTPLTVRSIAVKPASAASVLADRWRDWTDKEAWSGVSLSRIIGGRTGMELPLPLIVTLSAAIACGAYLVLRRWRGWPLSALTLAAIVMCGWVLLDARWQWNIAANAASSWDDFAGRDLPNKRLMGVDSELEKIASDVRPLIPRDARLFVFAQDPGVGGRLAYLLLPAKIYYDITQSGYPSSDRFKPGDLLLFHHKPRVRYSPERKEMLLDDRIRIRAEVIHVNKRGAVLAKVL